MKKLLAIFLLAVMILSTACTSAPELMSFIEEADLNNLKDVELNWLYKLVDGTNVSYTVDTPQYDALLKRVKEIENSLGCTIKTKIEQHGDALINVDFELMAGTLIYDTVLFAGDPDSYKGDLYYPITDFSEYIDWTDSEKYGNKQYLEASMYKGVPYSVSPMYWPGFDGVGLFVAAYNRDLFKQNNLTDLHEYYEQGTWTYDTFRNEFIANVTIDTASEVPMYALQTDQPDFYQALVYSNNVKFIEEAEDGTLIPTPYPQSFVNAMTWGQNLISDYKEVILYDSDTYELEEYTRGEIFVAFAPSTAVTTGKIAYNENSTFDSGVMPLPCGPDATYGEWGQCVQGSHGFSIPVTTENPEAAAMFINLICEPLVGFEDPTAFYNMIFEDETDLEIYMQLGKNYRYDYTHVGDKSLGRQVGEGFGNAVCKGSSLTERMESYINTMTTLVEDWMMPNYKTVYGE